QELRERVTGPDAGVLRFAIFLVHLVGDDHAALDPIVNLKIRDLLIENQTGEARDEEGNPVEPARQAWSVRLDNRLLPLDAAGASLAADIGQRMDNGDAAAGNEFLFVYEDGGRLLTPELGSVARAFFEGRQWQSPFGYHQNTAADGEALSMIRRHQLGASIAPMLRRFKINLRRNNPNQPTTKSGRKILQDVIKRGNFLAYSPAPAVVECRAMVDGQRIGFRLQLDADGERSAFFLSARRQFELTEETADSLAQQADLQALAAAIGWPGAIADLVRLAINPGQGRPAEGLPDGVEAFRAVYSRAPGENHLIDLQARINDRQQIEAVTVHASAQDRATPDSPPIDDGDDWLENFLDWSPSPLDGEPAPEIVEPTPDSPAAASSASGASAVETPDASASPSPSASAEEDAPDIADAAPAAADTASTPQIAHILLDLYQTTYPAATAHELAAYRADIEAVYADITETLRPLEALYNVERRALNRIRLNNPIRGSYDALLNRRQALRRMLDDLEQNDAGRDAANHPAYARLLAALESGRAAAPDIAAAQAVTAETFANDTKFLVLHALMNEIDERLPQARYLAQTHRLSQLTKAALVERLRRLIEKRSGETLAEWRLIDLRSWVDDFFRVMRIVRNRRAAPMARDPRVRAAPASEPALAGYRLDGDCLALIRHHDGAPDGPIHQ
ncbi:MAG TPA: hypothetical protein VNC50_12515, partial [Planctomycetia bacterium]|nr:hypothetical protein [Planctomycetia bacterium]